MGKKTKFKKGTKNVQIGDVYSSTNQRLKNYYKGNRDGRMVVISSSKKGSQSVNAITGKEHKNKLPEGYVGIDKKRNKFLNKKSVVSLETHKEVYNKKSEISKGLPVKRKVDVSDKDVFKKKVGKLHWKDKKAIKKALKNKS